MKLHLGSGPVHLDGWLNVDLDAPNADLHLDLRKPLSFADESIEYIFNEHFIEHITREEALALLKECHRVLSKYGVLRLSTPNLKYLAVSYLARNIDEWGELWRPTNPCRLLNEGMRSWGHEFLYDAEELILILSEAGFSNVRFVRWRESSIDELAGLETRPFHNEVILEAVKSGHIDASQEVIADLGENEPWLRDVHKIILNQVKRLEQTIADQATHIGNVESDWKARGEHIVGLEQTIADQATHIGNVEAELTEFRLSWYGRLKSAAKKLLH